MSAKLDSSVQSLLPAGPGHKRRSALRVVAGKLLLLAGSIVVALFLVEISLRLLHLDEPLIYEPDTELGWRHIPGVHGHYTAEGDGWYQINSWGYRDSPRELAKAPNSFRIAVFGDSMTEALGVNLEETFCNQLQEKLRQEGYPVEVLNFGVSGYSPIQEYLLFKRAMPRFKPDLVILALFLDNDVADCHPQLGYAAQSAPFVRFDGSKMVFDYSRPQREYAAYHQSGVYTVRKYSALYRLLRKWHWQKGRFSAAASSGVGIPLRFRVYQKVLQPEWEQAWKTVEHIVLAFAADAKQLNVPFVVLSVPAGQVVSKEAWQTILHAHPAMAKEDLDLDGPDQRLQTFSQQHGLLLLQPYAIFRRTAKSPPLHFGIAGHLTARGHRLLAESIEGFLKQNHLLPEGFAIQGAE